MYEKIILLSLTYLVGLGELALAVFFWATKSKNEIRKVMALLDGSLSIWALLGAVTAYRAASYFIIFANKIEYLLAVLVLTSLLHLTIIFPYSVFRLNLFYKILLYVPVVIFGAILFSSDAIFLGFTLGPNTPGDVIAGPLLGLYNIYLMVLYLFAVGITIFKVKRADGIHKKNLILVLMAIILGGLPTVLIDLVLPLFKVSQPNYLIATSFTGIWLGVISYIVTKK